MGYIYETHMHTNVGSRCSFQTPEEQIRRLHHYGYSGAFVTDHFLNGNTAVPKGLSWEDSMDALYHSYERAKAEGDKIGFDVFFGFESFCQGTDILTYGLEKDWLKAHPEIMEMPICQYCEFAREQGGFVVHAHPFREAGLIRLIPRSVDAVEILNGNRSDFENERAAEFARNYGIPVTAGSDLHIPQTRLVGVEVPERFSSPLDYGKAVLNGTAVPVTVYDRREEKILCD